MICEQGDIIAVDFEPSVGHEPNKYRPALVVSSNTFNARSSLTAVCPITSVNNGYPLHVGIDHEEVRGFVCVEQVRTVDLSNRRCKRLAQASEDDMGLVLSYVASIFDVSDGRRQAGDEGSPPALNAYPHWGRSCKATTARPFARAISMPATMAWAPARFVTWVTPCFTASRRSS